MLRLNEAFIQQLDAFGEVLCRHGLTVVSGSRNDTVFVVTNKDVTATVVVNDANF